MARLDTKTLQKISSVENFNVWSRDRQDQEPSGQVSIPRPKKLVSSVLGI